MRVWLDDLRPAPPGWTWATTVESTIAALRSGRVTEISLDYDLDHTDGRRKGIEVLEWLEPTIAAGRIVMPVIHIHSANPMGAKRMTHIWQRIEMRNGLSWG